MIRLCRELKKLPAELEGMSAWELALFDADMEERPPAEDQADFHGSLLAALIYNSNRGKNKPAKEVKDFSVRVDRKPKRAQTRGEMETILRALAGANSGPQQGIGRG